MAGARSARVPRTLAPPGVPARRRPGLPGLRGARIERSLLARVGLVLAIAVVLVVGVSGLLVDRSGGEAAAVGEVIEIDGGELRVDAVRYWNQSQHMRTMPGMKMPDPLPKGYRRFWVDVTMLARGGPGIRVEPAAFAVAAPAGGQPIGPHWSSDGLERILPGAEGTLMLLFQVPEGQQDVLLLVPGTSRSILVPGPDGTTAGDHDNGAHGH